MVDVSFVFRSRVIGPGYTSRRTVSIGRRNRTAASTTRLRLSVRLKFPHIFTPAKVNAVDSDNYRRPG